MSPVPPFPAIPVAPSPPLPPTLPVALPPQDVVDAVPPAGVAAHASDPFLPSAPFSAGVVVSVPALPAMPLPATSLLALTLMFLALATSIAMLASPADFPSEAFTSKLSTAKPSTPSIFQAVASLDSTWAREEVEYFQSAQSKPP